ncbi:MAG: penicillin-binding protein activator [Gammaproteobacteria bacterium]|nr:penicillin-binding protein activator [Gammaproteobacteria bacterium]
MTPAAIRAINKGQRLPLLYQFSLAPEDEARQIAERAWFDGHAHALAMTPQNEWGDRVYKAFSHTFEELGGKVLERVSYSSEGQQYSGRCPGVAEHRQQRAALQGPARSITAQS